MASVEQLENSENVLSIIQDAGISLDEPRLKAVMDLLRSSQSLTKWDLQFLTENSFMRKILHDDLAISKFPHFRQVFRDIFEAVAPYESGELADYIPQLAAQDPNYWAAAACSTDGQQYALGDVDVPFCVHACSRPITYCMALELNGAHRVHDHVGHEPSGRNFNARELMKRDDGKNVPHNPCIISGAIMAAALVRMEDSEWDRFDYVMAMWQKLCGGKRPGFHNNAFTGQRAKGARNFTLAASSHTRL